jgi:hypothetical protein
MFRDVVGRPEREEVKVSWRSMHYEELHALYFSPFVKAVEMGRMCCTHEMGRMCCTHEMGRMCCTREKKEENLLSLWKT